MSRSVVIRPDLCVPELGIVPVHLPGPGQKGRSIDRCLEAAFLSAIVARGFIVMTSRGRRELVAAERIAFT